MKETRDFLPDPDKLVHERARLRILVYLASADSPETGFVELRTGLGMTAGNLSAQLATLERAGFVELSKSFREKKPYTGILLTPKGGKALVGYLDEMDTLLARLKAKL